MQYLQLHIEASMFRFHFSYCCLYSIYTDNANFGCVYMVMMAAASLRKSNVIERGGWFMSSMYPKDEDDVVINRRRGCGQ